MRCDSGAIHTGHKIDEGRTEQNRADRTTIEIRGTTIVEAMQKMSSTLLLVCMGMCILHVSVLVSGSLVTPDPLASVSTLIGAGGIGFQAGSIAPGPQVPFGAMRLSPDTSLDSIWLQFQHFGGYSYMDTHIRCFSHTHMVGAGVNDWGNFGVMAYGQEINQQTKFSSRAWYRSAFSHDTEIGVPGLYAVALEDPQVQVRLTVAGTHAGMHEYTFLPRSAQATNSVIVMDACASLASETDACRQADLNFTLNADNSISVSAHILMHGALTGRSPNGGVDVYFAAQIFSPVAVESYGLWVDNEFQSEATSGSSTKGSLGVFFDFGGSQDTNITIPIWTGISFINASMAELNMLTQFSVIGQNPSFDEVLAQTQAVWSKTLGLIEITVDEEEEEQTDELIDDTEQSSDLAAPTFTMTTFALDDTKCAEEPTGALYQFSADQCVHTPASVQPQYNSMQLYNVDLNVGNYSLNIYAESPLCDDFVGWYTNGTFGNNPEDCRSTLYFSFRINVTMSETKEKTIKQLNKKTSSTPAVTASQFYSLLYHSFLAPTTYTETNQIYLGMDGQVHQWPYTHADGNVSSYYSDMSLWDTHRTQNPLLGLLLPNVAADSVRSLFTMYNEGGDIPRWPLANVYTGCMSGNHGLVSVADWLLKDVPATDLGLDVEELYAAAIAMINTTRVHGGRDDLGNYTTIGYVTAEADSKGAAMTLEYALDDWAVGNIAWSVLGNEADAEALWQRAQNYKNVWEPNRQLMCPRLYNGSFACPSSFAALWPYPLETGYTEADAWQEMWFVPHDPDGLIQLFPSVDEFVTKLDTFVSQGFNWIFPHEEIPNDYYWSGNEPDIFAPWMFNWAGRPDLTQNYTRELLKIRYKPTPEIGLPGNDDYGTISAWATFASLGFYPQAGTTTYALGSPAFPKAVIHRPARFGGDLTIFALNVSDSSRYVSSATVDGEILELPFIDHPQLTGATLEFQMTETPTPDAFTAFNGLMKEEEEDATTLE